MHDERSGSKWASRGLSRDLVVNAALTWIDEHGPHSLTMRGLGQELGVEAMSLYRYVTGREDLLDGVVAHLLDGLHDSLDRDLGGSWQGYLQTLANAVRKIAVDHPEAFPLIATRHPAAPWLRPPLRSIELVDDFLSSLCSYGFTDDQAVESYRSFSSFLLGGLLLEATAHGAAMAPVGLPMDEGDPEEDSPSNTSDLSSAPTVARLEAKLSEDHSQEEFEIALEATLERMAATLGS